MALLALGETSAWASFSVEDTAEHAMMSHMDDAECCDTSLEHSSNQHSQESESTGCADDCDAACAKICLAAGLMHISASAVQLAEHSRSVYGTFLPADPNPILLSPFSPPPRS